MKTAMGHRLLLSSFASLLAFACSGSGPESSSSVENAAETQTVSSSEAGSPARAEAQVVSAAELAARAGAGWAVRIVTGGC